MVSINGLPQAKRVQVVKALVEGNSIRATVRMAGVAKNTVSKLLVELGEACSQYQDDALRGLTCRRVEADEIWAFCYAKQANVPAKHKGEFGYGDIWTWMAMDADTKLVPSWLVGERDTPTAIDFMVDVRERIANRTQLTTDGLACYLTAVEEAFGADVDYGQLVKVYGHNPDSDRRYSPSRFITAEKPVGQRGAGCGHCHDKPHRATEPDYADGDAPLHSPDKWVQQEGREPSGSSQPPLHALQLRPAPQESCQSLPSRSRDGGWGYGPRLVHRGNRRADQLTRELPQRNSRPSSSTKDDSDHGHD